MSGEVLFLAHRVPFPPDRGDKIRSWNVLKGIAKLAPVHVCAIGEKPEQDWTVEAPDRGRFGAIVRALITGRPASVEAFASRALQQSVTRLLAERPIATIYAFSGQMAQFVPASFKGRFVMDFVDMDSAKFAAFGGFANRQEANRLLKWEHRVAEHADLSLFVSEAEATLFRARTGLPGIEVLENGVDLARYDPGRAYASIESKGTPLIVFTGQMDYPPNIEAASDFARKSLPAIRAIHPNACFAIVGRAPSMEVRLLERLPGVLVTGEVDDPRDWLAAADVVVAPLKLARGIQNKVLEAMAMAKPIVASPPAAEGIDAKAGRDLLVADGPGAVLALLNDPLRAKALGHAARARMVERYSWDMRLAGLSAILGLDA